MLPVTRLRASFSRIFAFAASMRARCSGVYSGVSMRVASRNFLTICLTKFLTFEMTVRATADVFG